MFQLTDLLKHTILISLAPLSLYALISLLERPLRHSLFNSDPQNNLENLSFNQNGCQGQQVLVYLVSLLTKPKTLNLDDFPSFLNLFFFIAVINLIHQVCCYLIFQSNEKKKVNSLLDISSKQSAKKGNNSITVIGKEHNFPFKRYRKIIQGMILYGIFFSRFAFAFSAIAPSDDLLSIDNNHHRLLEEEGDSDLFYSNNELSDVRRLSIGKALSSLRINPIEVVLSKDNKLAFAILRYYGSLRVIDISDDQNPIVIGSLENLAPIEQHSNYEYKKMVLSADGKTLFATKVTFLEIIDVSNPQNPTLMSSLEEPVLSFMTGAEFGVPAFCLPTIALSSDETTFYVASVGLQIFNVTNLSNPQVLYAYVSPKTPRYNRRLTSLALLPDSKTLLYGNGSLDFYDVSDPTNPKLSSSYTSPDLFINSIRLSKSLKRVYAVGLTLDGTATLESSEAILEEIDISQRISLSRYEISVSHGDRFHYPSIIALSPNETNIFVMWGLLSTIKNSDVETIGFDFSKKQIMTQSKTLFTGAKIFLMVPGTNDVITDSNSQFQIVKLFKDYPNTINFCLTNSSQENSSFHSKKRFVEPSPDSNFLFTMTREALFESYNFTSPPQLLGSFKPDVDHSQFLHATFIVRNNIAIVREGRGILFMDISDPTNITLIKSVYKNDSWGIFASAHSPQENILVVFSQKECDHRVTVFDFSDFSSIKETNILNFYEPGMLMVARLTTKGRILFFLAENFTIYNLSDYNNPKLVFSKPLAPFASVRWLLAMELSSDDKTLFILFFKSNQEMSLTILDVSDLTNPRVLSVLDLPTGNVESNSKPFILSRDMKRGFLTTNNEILVINLQNLSSPVIIGMISFSSLGIEIEPDHDVISLSNFFLSPDEKIGYLSDFSETLFKVNLDIPYTLYLPQEKFFLGKKSSEPLLFLRSDNNNDFLPMSSADYKITKLLLYDISIVSSKTSPDVGSYSLPPWITFDYENQVLSVDSKTQKELGSRTLYSISSKKIPWEAFSSTLSGSITSEDMVALLINFGYLDNQRFLTSSFGSYEDFFLPSQYKESRETVYKTLQSHRIETFTGFTVLPSLSLLSGEKFSLKTPSENSIKVGIKLRCSEAKFLQKTYNTLQPVITEQKSRLTIEGPLDLVNEALEDLVINVNKTNFVCSGEIAINDQMNPPVRQVYQNISEYFFKNTAPHINTLHPLTLQKQIDLNTLYTGQSFSISIDPQTFIDNYTEALSYELIREASSESKRNLPSWITYNGGLTIKGIPPEEFWDREIHLVLIVKNEFKRIEVPFALNINITLIFVAKVLLRYSPYILTILGLIVYANKIYNIGCKKRYRYPRDFDIKIGEEITSSVIPPMIFIWKEKQESALILKHLKAKVSRELGKKSIKNIELAEHFINSEGSRISREKLENEIQETVKDIPEKILKKLRSYFHGSQASKNLINQIIFNQLTLWLLENDSETKKFFDMIKDDWTDLVEWDRNGMCKIKESQLLELVAQADLHLENNSLQEKNDDYTLMTEQESMKEIVNVSLLKNAIEGHAFNKQSIDYHSTTAHIMIKFKKQTNFIKRFVKKDLEDVNFSDRGKMTYGIYFKVQNDVLSFHGIPEEKFLDKTVVVQITTKKQRILNEIWIHGLSKDQPNHSIAKGIGYEIY